MNNADITFANNEFTVTGDLDFTNVMHVYQKALKQFETAGTDAVIPRAGAGSIPDDTLIFNFADLKTSNSAGLALIVEWQRYAKQHNKRIEFRNVSSQLQSIAEAAGLEAILFI